VSGLRSESRASESLWGGAWPLSPLAPPGGLGITHCSRNQWPFDTLNRSFRINDLCFPMTMLCGRDEPKEGEASFVRQGHCRPPSPRHAPSRPVTPRHAPSWAAHRTNTGFRWLHCTVYFVTHSKSFREFLGSLWGYKKLKILSNALKQAVAYSGMSQVRKVWKKSVKKKSQGSQEKSGNTPEKSVKFSILI